MKRASYRAGVAWIAVNDEPTDRDMESIAGYVSTLLLADLFEIEPARVAHDVQRARHCDACLRKARERGSRR